MKNFSRIGQQMAELWMAKKRIPLYVIIGILGNFRRTTQPNINIFQ